MGMVVHEWRREPPVPRGYITTAWMMTPIDFADGRIKVYRHPASSDGSHWLWHVYRWWLDPIIGGVVGGPRGYSPTWEGAMRIASNIWADEEDGL